MAAGDRRTITVGPELARDIDELGQLLARRIPDDEIDEHFVLGYAIAGTVIRERERCPTCGQRKSYTSSHGYVCRCPIPRDL